MTLREPSIFFRALVLGAQGVFYNMFCKHCVQITQRYGLMYLLISLGIPYLPKDMPSFRRLLRGGGCSHIVSYKSGHLLLDCHSNCSFRSTRCIEDIEAGRLPEWSSLPAPSIAIDYWRLKPNANLLDVIYAVRSDESTHRFVNHSFANLDVQNDINPFALREPDMHVKGKKPG